MPLVITSGYAGTTHLVPTSGYGPGVAGGAFVFLFDSVELRTNNVIRARFTRALDISNPAPANRADVAANYSLVGEFTGIKTVILATPASDDNEVIDLYLSADIVPDTYTLTVASTVQSVQGFTLLAPYNFIFTVSVFDQDSIGLGAVNNPSILGN